jgi:hypothetical protein
LIGGAWVLCHSVLGPEKEQLSHCDLGKSESLHWIATFFTCKRRVYSQEINVTCNAENIPKFYSEVSS